MKEIDKKELEFVMLTFAKCIAILLTIMTFVGYYAILSKWK